MAFEVCVVRCLARSPLTLAVCMPSDEPTSGLDSTASKGLAAALQEVARSDVTCAAVIHQPSWQCLQLFDHLLLLGKGGRTGGQLADCCSGLVVPPAAAQPTLSCCAGPCSVLQHDVGCPAVL
jgi:ABC-type Mn2+/Zn2+ transport system ATPase subunit